MRVLMLSQSYAPVIGGEERVVEELSHHLVARGHEVSVATLRVPDGETEPPRTDVAVHRLPSSLDRIPGLGSGGERRFAPPLADPVTTRALRRVVAAERPDVVHGHNWLIHSYLPLARRRDTALVLSLHDYGSVCATKRLFLHGAPCSGPALGKCLRHAARHYDPVRGPLITAAVLGNRSLRRHVDMFLPISTAVRDLCGLGPGDPHHVIHNFIGELPGSPPAAQIADLPDEPFILFFGDVSRDKGADCLAEAYAGLDSPPPLVMIGRNLLDPPLRQEGVTVLGPRPYPVAIEAIRRCMFTVAPSAWPEPFGLVALEASAAGRPVIASAIGGLSDIVADGETGLLVPPGDRVALRGALDRLIGDPALRKRLGAGGHARTGLFSPDGILPQFEAAYEEALLRRRSAGRG